MYCFNWYKDMYSFNSYLILTRTSSPIHAKIIAIDNKTFLNGGCHGIKELIKVNCKKRSRVRKVITS